MKQTAKIGNPHGTALQQQKAHFGGTLFYMRLKHTLCKMYENSPARITVRSPPGSTETFYERNHKIQQQPSYPRATPFSPVNGVHTVQSFIPHFVRGIHHPKSPLFSPYPAIPPYVVRTPHPGITDDREHIHHQLHRIVSCIHQFQGSRHVCHA